MESGHGESWYEFLGREIVMTIWEYGGIDASLTNVGLCKMDWDGNYEHKSLGESGITKLVGMDRAEKLEDMARSIAKYLNCDMVAIEGYSFGSRGRATINLGELGGLIRFYLNRYRTPFIEVPPTALKKWVTGKGNADKTKMAMALYKAYGVEFDNDDEADAYALCRLLECLNDGTEPRNQQQRQVIEALNAKENPS